MYFLCLDGGSKLKSRVSVGATWWNWCLVLLGRMDMPMDAMHAGF